MIGKTKLRVLLLITVNIPADDGPNLWVTHESDLADAYLKSIDYVFKGNKRLIVYL